VDGSFEHGGYESNRNENWRDAQRIEFPDAFALPSVEEVERVHQRFFDAYVAVGDLADRIIRFGFPRVSRDTAERLADASHHVVYGECLVRLYSALAFGDRQLRDPLE